MPVDFASETLLRIMVDGDDGSAVLVGGGVSVKSSLFDCARGKGLGREEDGAEKGGKRRTLVNRRLLEI